MNERTACLCNRSHPQLACEPASSVSYLQEALRMIHSHIFTFTDYCAPYHHSQSHVALTFGKGIRSYAVSYEEAPPSTRLFRAQNKLDPDMQIKRMGQVLHTVHRFEYKRKARPHYAEYCQHITLSRFASCMSTHKKTPDHIREFARNKRFHWSAGNHHLPTGTFFSCEAAVQILPGLLIESNRSMPTALTCLSVLRLKTLAGAWMTPGTEFSTEESSAIDTASPLSPGQMRVELGSTQVCPVGMS